MLPAKHLVAFLATFSSGALWRRCRAAQDLELPPAAACADDAEECTPFEEAAHFLQLRGSRIYRRGWHQQSSNPYEKCYLAVSNCSLAELRGKPTLVYPGGGTGCLNGDEYAFAVVPGDADKLLYYFEGGGACWEANGAVGKQTVWMCIDSLADAIGSSGYGYGVQNFSDPRNPFAAYTVVEPLYCAGDAFIGNGSLEDFGTPYPQKGLANGLAARSWALANFGAVELTSFVISGFSAGAIGAMTWADTLLGALSYKQAAVLLDSYAAVFPPGTQSRTLKRWGACDTPFWPAEMRSKCHNVELTVHDVLAMAMAKYPTVGFASIQSKADGTQLSFYQGVARSYGLAQEAGITDPQFYNASNRIFGNFSSNFANYVVYLVNGDLHCYTNQDAFYTASPAGSDQSSLSGQWMLYEWVEDFVALGPVASQCDGPVLGGGAESASYCDRRLAAKVLRVEEAPAPAA